MFKYELPPHRIAQRPCSPVHAARMLVIERESGILKEQTFIDLPQYLKPEDLIIFNDTKVIPARLIGKRGNLAVELLLVRERCHGQWEAIGKPLRKLKKGDLIEFTSNLAARLLERTAEYGVIVEFIYDGQAADRQRVLCSGLMPIPPYIRAGKSDMQDLLDYQTIFAKVEGSVAAPTASLHFSEELLVKIREKGCGLEFVTLHVGLSSIMEVDPGRSPGSERFSVSPDLKDKITAAKSKGGSVIAVGTTVVRALESAARMPSFSEETSTELFIRPGFEFCCVDRMITNFHMPGSTHLLLVEAFLGDRELMARSYEFALNNNFRFFSYGDGMLII